MICPARIGNLAAQLSKLAAHPQISAINLVLIRNAQGWLQGLVAYHRAPDWNSHYPYYGHGNDKEKTELWLLREIQRHLASVKQSLASH